MPDFIVPNYSFSVSIDDKKVLPFHKISGMKSELEYESYHEGGENAFTHILLKPISSAGKLELTRYLRSGDANVDIMVGEKLSAPLYVGVPRPGGDGDEGKKGYSMMFTDCFVVGHRFSDLDAMGNQIMEETIEIAYQRMFYLPDLEVTST